jgi:hypothetical protein
MQWSQFLPAVREDYQGPKVAFYFLVFIAVVSTIRSLIHMFAADGGANSIAGIVIDVEGGMNIVAMFGQWGASQLILSVFYWLAILRYRFLTPFMLAMILLEQILRIGVGELKPMEIAAPPPGAIASQLLLPISAIMLVLSLWRPGMKFGSIRGKA